MTLNNTGAISLGGSTTGQSVNLELGVSATATISMNQTSVRTLTGTTAGTALVMPTNFYGKSSSVTASYTFTTSTVNASLNIATLSGYVAGSTNVTVTVNSGVYLWANTTGGYGLSFSNGTTGDTLLLVNNGFIMGQGGYGGGTNYGVCTQYAPIAGGSALNLSYSATITNTSGYIGGGGGGGDGSYYQFGGGGGAGGAIGGNGVGYDNCCLPIAGGAGGTAGAIGASGGDGTASGGEYPAYPGGGGGRIMPGTGGAGGTGSNGSYGRGGGAGGGGASTDTVPSNGGSAGSAAVSGNDFAGGGGGYGAYGANAPYGGTTGGKAGGKAINLNGKTVTWTGGSASSSRAYGAVS